MCNNNGACRKLEGGVMCPSYRVTRDERDVTRGRANTLRLAITGQLGPDALTSDEMAETLKLCVSCKACRRECPTGVDMARMKIEVQAARVGQARALAARPAGRLSAALCAARRALARARQPAQRPVRGCGNWSETIAGFSARREPAALATRCVARAGAAAPAPTDGREVVLFADTFNRYFEPENIEAALGVLAAAGYRVHLPKPVGRQHASALLRAHVPVGRAGRRGAARGRALRRRACAVRRARHAGRRARAELHSRLPRRDSGAAQERRRARRWPRNALLFEEFLAREAEAGTARPAAQAGRQARAAARPLPPEIVRRHGRGRGGARLVPELTVETIESSCCGMAGAFGYGADTIDVSLKMAELSLLPAVRKAEADTLIVADGTSCRHQIKDGTGREALHVARVLAMSLNPSGAGAGAWPA